MGRNRFPPSPCPQATAGPPESQDAASENAGLSAACALLKSKQSCQAASAGGGLPDETYSTLLWHSCPRILAKFTSRTKENGFDEVRWLRDAGTRGPVYNGDYVL